MYASMKSSQQTVQDNRSAHERPYAQGTLVVAILLKRHQQDQAFAAARNDTPAERLWLLAASGRL